MTGGGGPIRASVFHKVLDTPPKIDIEPEKDGLENDGTMWKTMGV